MTREIGVVMRKEFRELAVEGRGSGRLGRLTPFARVLVPGIALPLNFATPFLSPGP